MCTTSISCSGVEEPGNKATLPLATCSYVLLLYTRLSLCTHLMWFCSTILFTGAPKHGHVTQGKRRRPRDSQGTNNLYTRSVCSSGMSMLITWFLLIFQRRVLQLESTVSEKEQQCQELCVAVEELKPKSRPPPPQVTEIGLQTEQLEFHRTEIVSVRHHSGGSGGTGIRRRVKSPVHREASKMPIGNSRSGGELDVSLENEMRAAGIEVNDSFDSSEGIGFSETTLDDLLGSAQSLESFKSDQVGKEEETAERRSLSTTKGASGGQPFSAATVTKWADVRGPDIRPQEHPVGRQPPYTESEERAGINQLLKEQVSELPAEGEHGDLGANPPVISLEELGEEEEEEENGSSDSDGDLPGLRSSRGGIV